MDLDAENNEKIERKNDDLDDNDVDIWEVNLDVGSLFKTVKVPERFAKFKLKSLTDLSDDKCLILKEPVDQKTPNKKDEKTKRKEIQMSSRMTKIAKPKQGGDVDSITQQMKELVKMNMMIQSKLSSLENSLSEAQKKELEAADEELSEEVIGDSDDDEVVELPEQEKEELASELVDISMEDEDLTIEERDDLTIEDEKAPEDILDRESRELLESESFEDVKEDLLEEKAEIKEDDDKVHPGHQMDEDEEEAKFNVEVKEEMVDPSELNMAPGWKVKFGKGRNATRFYFSFSVFLSRSLI